MREWNAKLRSLADRQRGRVSWAQLKALGIDDKTIVRWTDGGFLHRVLPRVYAVGHRAQSVEADLTAAVLYAGPGAMLSHATALWWRGLIDRQPRTIDVSTPRRCQSLPCIRVHARRKHASVSGTGACRPRAWSRRCSTTPRLAPLERVRHALANADYHKVLDVPALQVIAGNGRIGSATLRKALTRHEPKLAHTRSPLERLFLPLCERAGIPLPDVNVWIEGVLVDGVWREQKVVVELDGKDNHSSWAQIQHDRSNELILRGAGFEVVRYGTQQLEEQPANVETDLLRALGLPR